MVIHQIKKIDSSQEGAYDHLSLVELEQVIADLDQILKDKFKEISELEKRIEALGIRIAELKTKSSSSPRSIKVARNSHVNSMKPIAGGDLCSISISYNSIELALSEGLERAIISASSIKATFLEQKQHDFYYLSAKLARVINAILESASLKAYKWLKKISESIPRYFLPTFSYPSPKPLNNTAFSN